MKRRHWFQIAWAIFTVAAVRHAIKSRQSHGSFKGVPFEFRFPTPSRIKERAWNPDDKRIFTPNVFGVGWGINAYQVRETWRSNRDRWQRLMALVGRGRKEAEPQESEAESEERE